MKKHVKLKLNKLMRAPELQTLQSYFCLRSRQFTASTLSFAFDRSDDWKYFSWKIKIIKWDIRVLRLRWVILKLVFFREERKILQQPSNLIWSRRQDIDRGPSWIFQDTRNKHKKDQNLNNQEELDGLSSKLQWKRNFFVRLLFVLKISHLHNRADLQAQQQQQSSTKEE